MDPVNVYAFAEGNGKIRAIINLVCTTREFLQGYVLEG